MWKILALIRGWRGAYDYDMDLQVVWRDDRHFIGPMAWKSAALAPIKK